MDKMTKRGLPGAMPEQGYRIGQKLSQRTALPTIVGQMIGGLWIVEEESVYGSKLITYSTKELGKKYRVVG